MGRRDAIRESLRSCVRRPRSWLPPARSMDLLRRMKMGAPTRLNFDTCSPHNCGRFIADEVCTKALASDSSAHWTIEALLVLPKPAGPRIRRHFYCYRAACVMFSKTLDILESQQRWLGELSEVSRRRYFHLDGFQPRVQSPHLKYYLHRLLLAAGANFRASVQISYLHCPRRRSMS